jgi:hypothetical protein
VGKVADAVKAAPAPVALRAVVDKVAAAAVVAEVLR